MKEEDKEKYKKQLDFYKKDLGVSESKIKIRPIIKKNYGQVKENSKIDENLEKLKERLNIQKQEKKDLTESFEFSSEKDKKRTSKNTEKTSIVIEGSKVIKKIIPSISKENEEILKKEAEDKKINEKSILNKKTTITQIKKSDTNKKYFEIVNETEVKTEKIEQDTKKNISEKVVVQKVGDESQINKIDEVIIPNEVHEQPVKKKGKNLIFLILIPILLILFGYGIYKLYNKNLIAKENERISRELDLKIIAIQDSILEYEKNVKTFENDIDNSNIANKISDTIYSITSEHPKGYYVVIGAYSETSNAELLLQKNQTNFEGSIFEGETKRVVLSIGNEEGNILNDLQTIREDYKGAWLMYNKN